MRAARFPVFLALAALASYAFPAHGQARAGCPMHPQNVAAMRGCYRPLLVFSPAGTDPRLRKQEALLDSAADDMMDRNMLFVPVLDHAQGYRAPLDAAAAELPEREKAALRKRFGVAPGSFRVVLLGEDGGAKLTRGTPVEAERFNRTIDAMPTRKREMQQPHSN